MVWIRIHLKSMCCVWLIYHINVFPPTAFFSFIPPVGDPSEKPSPLSCRVFHIVDFVNSIENLTLNVPLPPRLFSVFSVWLLDIETWGDSGWNFYQEDIMGGILPFSQQTSWTPFCYNIISPSITELCISLSPHGLCCHLSSLSRPTISLVTSS